MIGATVERSLVGVELEQTHLELLLLLTTLLRVSLDRLFGLDDAALLHV